MACTICSNAWFEHNITESDFNVVDKHTTGLAVSAPHFLGMADLQTSPGGQRILCAAKAVACPAGLSADRAHISF